MNQKNLVTATGKNRLDILSRINSLYLQRHIEVESVILEKGNNNEDALYKVYSEAPEETIKLIVNQINKIVDIKSVNYSYKF